MKKNILVILSILIITILSGCQKKEEVSTYEQDRVAQYILDNVELIDGSEINKINGNSSMCVNDHSGLWNNG